MKTCTRCKKTKDKSEFHKNKSMPGGLHVYCKACRKELAADYYSRNAEAYAAYNDHRYRVRDVEKIAARLASGRAVQLGRMKPASAYPCKICGKQAKDYHHESYKKEDWFKVIPLCRSCHKNLHCGNITLQVTD